MNSTSQTPPKEHLRDVIKYLVDCLASDGQSSGGGVTAALGAVQPAPPPPPHAAKTVCEFLQLSIR